jgi:hypothetical protein
MSYVLPSMEAKRRQLLTDQLDKNSEIPGNLPRRDCFSFSLATAATGCGHDHLEDHLCWAEDGQNPFLRTNLSGFADCIMPVNQLKVRGISRPYRISEDRLQFGLKATHLYT